MLPTFENPPLPPAAYPHPDAFPAPVPTPGPLRAVRVLAWVQVGLWSLGAVGGVIVAAMSSTGLDGENETASWAAFGVFVGLVLAAAGALAAVALAVPALLLRDSRRRPRTGALIGLCIAQGVTALPALALVVSVRSVSGLLGVMVPLAGVAVAVTVIVLALQPACRTWAAQSWSRS